MSHLGESEIDWSTLIPKEEDSTWFTAFKWNEKNTDYYFYKNY